MDILVKSYCQLYGFYNLIIWLPLFITEALVLLATFSTGKSFNYNFRDNKTYSWFKPGDIV